MKGSSAMSPLLKKQSGLKPVTKYCIQSGIMAFCIMIFTYFCHSNTLTFGDDTVLRMDLYHQYGPLYSELYDRITQGSSLIYSWTSGLGGGFLGNLFNYCCSPFAFVLFICGHKNMPEAIALMILLKAVTSSVTFTYYINKTENCCEKFSPAFGLLYAFCGYFVAYSWNIMWLDAMAVFPLVILGIEKIINERKPALFCISLAVTMITNYYMAYMVCILSVIYFLYYFFGHYTLADRFPSKKKTPAVPEALPLQEADGAVPAVKTKKKKSSILESRFYVSGLYFAGAALVSFFTAAFALLPVVYALQSSSATSSTFPETLNVYFNFFDFIANHLPAVEPTIRSSGDIVLPNVYCGILSIILLPFYFMSSRISGKQKIGAAVLLGLFYLSFSINYLNYIWHGFHFPNDLPYRFSFAYSFILLTLVYKVVRNADEFSKKEFVVAGIALAMFVVFVDKLGSQNVEDKTIYLSLVFGVFYVILFGLLKSPHYGKNTVSTLLVFLIIVEICFCNTGNYVMSQPKANYTSDYDSYQEISSLAESSETDLFYRTELSKLRARMDPCWYGYNGVSTFSSMAYENTSAMMKSLGMFGNKINSYTYYPQTPIFNSFFALKYIYDNSDYLSACDNYTFISSNDTFDAYKYNYPLPLAFSVSQDIETWDTSSSDPFVVQNLLMEKSTGFSDVLEKVDATSVNVSNLAYVSVDSVNNGINFSVSKSDTSSEGTATVTIDVQEAGDYYVYAGSTKLSRLRITAEDFNYDYVSSSIQPITMGVGYQPEGAKIDIEFTVAAENSSASLTFAAAKTNEEIFKSAYNKICSNGLLELTSFNESSFTGNINVTNQNAFLFTSIPYDQSWRVKVDGNELSYYNAELENSSYGKIVAVGNGLIGFAVATGAHEISFEYVPRGLKEGLCLTVAGLVIMELALVISIIKKRRRSAEAQTDNESNVTEVPETESFVENIAGESELPPDEPPENETVLPEKGASDGETAAEELSKISDEFADMSDGSSFEDIISTENKPFLNAKDEEEQ